MTSTPGVSAAGPFSPIPDILEDLRQGRMVVLVDSEDRENEGDLICPAQLITPEHVNFMLRFGRGTLCVALTHARCRKLQLSPQVSQNTTRLGTAFTVTVDAGPQFGVTTGVSAFDRATTIRHLVAEEAVPEDFVRPGHISPLIARDGGVLVRNGADRGLGRPVPAGRAAARRGADRGAQRRRHHGPRAAAHRVLRSPRAENVHQRAAH